MSGCTATLMISGQVHTCDWTEPHTGHAHHNHDVNVTWTGATAEADPDDDPQAIRAAFDAAPKGVTAHPMVHVSGVRYHPDAMDTAHTETRRLRAALDAAQDEIEKRIEASERDRDLIRQLGAVVEHMAPAAYRAIIGGTS